MKLSLWMQIVALLPLIAIGGPLNPSFSPEAVQGYRIRADNGDAEAQYLLSTALANGLGITKDESKAFLYAKKAADHGYERALRRVGLGYEEGWGTESNTIKAAECYSRFVVWAKRTAKRGDADAQNSLGVCYLTGQGIKKDEAESVRWFSKSAEQGFAQAQYNLGWMYEKGIGVEKDEAASVRWYRKAAEQGMAEAQFNLGWIYEKGRGVKKDEVESVRWYRKAAEQGMAEAQFNLGVLYEDGRGVRKFKAEAVRWYKKAAEQGNAAAQNNLGQAYLNGSGVPKDTVEAFRWCRKSAEQGLADAQCNLGWMYEKGEGVEKDEVEAVRWYHKAAEQGDVVAQRNLGICYKYGRGVEKDEDEADQWFKKATRQDLAEVNGEPTVHKQKDNKPSYENWMAVVTPRKGRVYYLENLLMTTRITRWASSTWNKIPTAVIISADDHFVQKQFYVKIIKGKHDYVDGDPIANGFYRYLGVIDFHGSRLHTFEEVELSDELQKTYEP